MTSLAGPVELLRRRWRTQAHTSAYALNEPRLEVPVTRTLESEQADAAPFAAGSQRLWVVLPVYNEAAAIERVIEEWIPALATADPSFVLLVVDDGSTDDTPRLLDRLARRDARLRILTERNRGHGGACRRGYQIATSPESDAGWILQIDSDGQCDPADFAAFWNGRSEHPLQLGRRRREDGRLRTVTSRTLALLVSAAAGRSIRDPNVPFRLLRRDVLARALPLLPETGVDLLNAALTVICCEVATPRWVDIRFRERYAGRSHYRMGRMGGLAADLLRWLVARRATTRSGPPRLPSDRDAHDPAARVVTLLAWCALLAALAVYGARNLGDPGIWYDEAMQIHTSLGLHPMAEPFTPQGSLGAVVARNRVDQLDPGGMGVLLHFWISVFGTGVHALRSLSGLLTVAGLGALAILAWRWIRHPLAAPGVIALALIDPLIREHALEVRPYALELAAVWIAFWMADRFLARPAAGGALALGLALVVLLGSRYSAFLTAGAIAGALYLQRLPAAGGQARADGAALSVDGTTRRQFALVTLAMLAPSIALAAIARWALPGLFHRSTVRGGELVGYLQPYTVNTLSVGEAATQALRHLAHPAVLGLTLAAALAIWPGVSRLRSLAHTPASVFVRRAALMVLLLTVALWRWHPWNPSTKWSLYLHLVSIVCLLRLAADVLPALRSHRSGRLAVLATVIALLGAGVWLTAGHRRGRADVAFHALVRVGDLVANGEAGAGAVAVDPHPFPPLRYHYEFGSLRGRVEYPRAFLLPLRNVALEPAALCSAQWLLSFDSSERLQERHPGLRFERDPAARNLLRITARGPAETLDPAGALRPAGALDPAPQPPLPRCAAE